MSVPGYDNYRESGVEWLGSVPRHWAVDRLKASVRSSKGGVWGEEADGGPEDIICVRVADFDRVGLSVSLEGPTYRKVQLKDREGRVLKRGDMLLEKSGGGEKQPVGAVVLYDHDEAAVCSNFVSRIEGADGQNPRFWRYVHAAAYAVGLTARSLNQTSGIQNLDQSRYLDERGPFPPYSEQAAIAAFLDRETRKIDALVEAQRRLIELLKEKRQAVIAHVVTKGLDPTAPTKDSGVEWLGEVPAHWEVKPLKYLVRLRSGGTPSKDRLDYWSGDVPWASAKDLKADDLRTTQDSLSQSAVDEGAASTVATGSVLVLVRGMMLARTFPVCRALVPMAINQDLKAIDGRANVSNRYLAWMLRGTTKETLARLDETGHGTKALRMEAWLSMLVPLPPLREQELLADAVEQSTQQIDRLVLEAEAGIALLHERRAALISAAVTGKIDVRGLVREEAEAA